MTDGQRYSVTQNLMLPLCLIDQMLMRCRCCESVVRVCFWPKVGDHWAIAGTRSNGPDKIFFI